MRSTTKPPRPATSAERQLGIQRTINETLASENKELKTLTRQT